MDLFGNEVIRSLGLLQPYASLMILKDKLETRWVLNGKKPPFPRGKYLIYSCKRVFKPDEVKRISGPYLDDEWMDDFRYKYVGMALFIADLVGVRDMVWDDQEKAFVEWGRAQDSRQVILDFQNRRRIKMFPFKGKQGVGILTPEEKAQIEIL